MRTIRKAFCMQVYPECHAEYEKRHNELWPEMAAELKAHGLKSYSIFLDKKTSQLFGYVEITDEKLWGEMADTAINRKWWDFMKDVMETNPDNSPVSYDLPEVFHLD